MFRINHTDPWVRGDPYRTSRTISLQNVRTSGNPVHGRAPDDVAGYICSLTLPPDAQ